MPWFNKKCNANSTHNTCNSVLHGLYKLNTALHPSTGSQTPWQSVFDDATAVVFGADANYCELEDHSTRPGIKSNGEVVAPPTTASRSRFIIDEQYTVMKVKTQL